MTAVVAFGSTEGKLPVPAHLAEFAEMDTNIVTRERVPQLSFRGKTWRVIEEGNETIVTNKAGDPAAVVAGIIVDYNKSRSRAYFEGAYVEGQSKMPTCWSHDSVKPHSTVKEPPAPTCASCPMSAKGSKMFEGREGVACSQFKRAAFVPIQNLKHKPVLLKLPQTSIWDKDAKDEAAKGFYAFDQYLDMLKARGVNHTAQVVTKIKFDPRTSYPKLLFGPLDWLPQIAVDDIKGHVADREYLDKLLSVDPDGGTPGEESTEPATNGAAGAPAKASAPKTPAPAPSAPPAPVAEEDDDAALMGELVTAEPPASKPAAAKPAKPAVAAKPAKPAAAAKPAPTVEVVEPESPKADGIGDLLNSWGEE